MKKLLTVLTIISVLLFSLASVGFAKNDISVKNLKNIDVSSLSSKEINKLKKEIKELSDQDFDNFLMNYITTETDYTKAQKKLAKLDVQVTKPNEKTIKSSSLEAWELDVYATAAKRGGDTFFRLYSYYTPSVGETRPATYDVVSVTWDPSKADYYSYNTYSDTINKLRDYSKASNGTVLFNSFDTNWTSPYGTTFYVAVYVTPKTSSTWLDFGTHYEHTYSTTTYSGNVNPSVSYTYPGLITGTFDYTINYQSNETSWQIADTNAVWL